MKYIMVSDQSVGIFEDQSKLRWHTPLSYGVCSRCRKRYIPVIGVAFGTFQAAGFEIFLVENSALDVLDSVKKEMLELIEERKEKPQKFDIIQFLKPGMNKGDFCLNMEEILSKNPELTSKKILIPYLKNGEFNRLDVTCSHIPKWFNIDLGFLGFEYETVNELPNKKTIRIVHVQTL
jgi:Fe-only nitrogenase accessory protein AnfO